MLFVTWGGSFDLLYDVSHQCRPLTLTCLFVPISGGPLFASGNRMAGQDLLSSFSLLPCNALGYAVGDISVYGQKMLLTLVGRLLSIVTRT